jgi:hypothetical protein
VAAFAALVNAELSDPDGSMPRVATVASGDLSDQGARDELRAAAEAIAAKAPPVGS